MFTDLGWMYFLNIRPIMKEERRATVLSDAEFRRVIAVARAAKHGQRNAALLFVSFALGLRAKELAALRIGDVVDSQGGLRDEVVLGREQTKGGKQRVVYLTNKDVRKSITDYLSARKAKHAITVRAEAPLFLSAKGGAFTPNTMQMLFKHMYREAGFPDASSHSGRRTFATALIERGVDIKAVSSLMGHSSVGMTARYVQDNPLRLKRICEQVTLGV
jgi:integrase/recombinase XerD